MRIIATSDLHGARPEVPECDLLIIAGDLTANHTDGQIEQFNKWLDEAPATDKVVVAGNHDDAKVYDPAYQVKGVHYLFNERVDIQGLVIWGSPYTKPFGNWNFMPDDEIRKASFMDMPDKFDILVTHGPEYGVLDMNAWGEWCGDKVLASVLSVKQPYIHIFGHIHEGYGYTNIIGHHSFNVSYIDHKYANTRKLVEIKLDNANKLV